MTETAEHVFLGERFLRILEQFSRLDLYTYREADRRRFDFACALEHNWFRPLVGQTVWSHTHGIDKDLRMLLTDPDAAIAALIVRSTAKNEVRLAEALHDYESTPAIAPHLFKLKIFRVPPDFDADDPAQRQMMEEGLRRHVVTDILFGVVFARIAARDVMALLNGVTGVYPGLALQILHLKESEGYCSPRMIADRVGSGTAAVRERLTMLQSCGFLHGMLDDLSEKGRMFLALIDRTAKEHRAGTLSAELIYVLSVLGCRPTVVGDLLLRIPTIEPDASYNFDFQTPYEALLLRMVAAAPLASRFDPGETPPSWATTRFAERWTSERRSALDYFRPRGAGGS